MDLIRMRKRDKEDKEISRISVWVTSRMHWGEKTMSENNECVHSGVKFWDAESETSMQKLIYVALSFLNNPRYHIYYFIYSYYVSGQQKV